MTDGPTAAVGGSAQGPGQGRERPVPALLIHGTPMTPGTPRGRAVQIRTVSRPRGDLCTPINPPVDGPSSQIIGGFRSPRLRSGLPTETNSTAGVVYTRVPRPVTGPGQPACMRRPVVRADWGVPFNPVLPPLRPLPPPQTAVNETAAVVRVRGSIPPNRQAGGPRIVPMPKAPPRDVQMVVLHLSQCPGGRVRWWSR